jgi:hypothetical protein
LSGQKLTINGRIIAKSIRSASENIKIYDRGYPLLIDNVKSYFVSNLKDQKEAAKAFIDKFAGTETRIGLISYSKIATVVTDNYGNGLFTLSYQPNVDFLKAYIDNLQPECEYIDGTTTPMRNIETV